MMSSEQRWVLGRLPNRKWLQGWLQRGLVALQGLHGHDAEQLHRPLERHV